jgi:ElaB/YqjD/DUF883 family membrane-anchored ribosome-binding protein
MQNRDPYQPYDSPVQTDPSLSNQMGTSSMPDRLSEAGRSAYAKVEQGRQSAAGALDRAADALHRKADSIPGGQKASGVAHSAADKLHSTAHYIREHDFKDMLSNFEDVVRRRPGQALLGALAVGLLVGRAFRTRNY